MLGPQEVHGPKEEEERITRSPSYVCPQCKNEPWVRSIDGRPCSEVPLGDSVLEVVDRFCYLGDMLDVTGGCDAAAVARCKCA